jgi:hypothetical protein
MARALLDENANKDWNLNQALTARSAVEKTVGLGMGPSGPRGTLSQLAETRRRGETPRSFFVLHERAAQVKIKTRTKALKRPHAAVAFKTASHLLKIRASHLRKLHIK